MPIDIEKPIKKYGAIQCKCGVKMVLRLLRVLIIYATSKVSIRLLALSASVLQCDGCMHEVKVTDNHMAIADAGYGKAVNYKYVIDRKADAIFRITPDHFNFYDENGKKVDILLLSHCLNPASLLQN